MCPSTNNKHILIYPFSGLGHIIPILDFAHLLLRRGFTITAVVSPANRPLLDPLLDSHPSTLHTLLLSPPDHTSPHHPLVARVVASQQLFDPIARWFKNHPKPPIAIVSDFFLGWTDELASHLGIPRLVFWPSGALGSSILEIMWRDVPKLNAQNSGVDEDFLISLPEIPGSPEFRWWQLTHLTRHYVKGDPDLESFRKGMLANLTSWGIIYNSFEALEGVYIDSVKKRSGHDRVWAVGPLLPDEHGSMTSTGRGGSSAVPPDDLLRWLDPKPDDSVVYICFGSRTTLTEKQMATLVAAVERSTVNFILCVKESDSNSIPSGFEDRVGDKGFVVRGWAPQLAILRHRAVGTFLSHCGWNSTLEGVAAGVMMLAWPMGADQFANAKLLVELLGVGARVCEGGPESVPESVELSRLLAESVSGDRQERVKVKELSRAASEAVKGGTSSRDLDRFVEILCEL